MGKALGNELGRRLSKRKNILPRGIVPSDLGDVVQAACLAHDLGNPPFGHAGEEAVIHWFDQNRAIIPDHLTSDLKWDLSALEGNAQGFRIITQLENHIFGGGLRLTYATLGAYQKYPWTSERRAKKFGSYLSEKGILDEVGEKLGLEPRTNGWCRHPLAHLVEAADDICYAVIDVEDAVELGILRFEEAWDVLSFAFDETEKRNIQSNLAEVRMHRVNFARIRVKVFDKLIAGVIDTYMDNYDAVMDGNCDDGMFAIMDEEQVCRGLLDRAKKLGRDSIYTDQKKVELEIGCYATFDTLLSSFCRAAIDQSTVVNDPSGESSLNWKSNSIMRLLGDHAPNKANAPKGGWTVYQCLRRVIDFVCGMTDNYAVYVAKQLQGASFSGGQRP